MEGQLAAKRAWVVVFAFVFIIVPLAYFAAPPIYQLVVEHSSKAEVFIGYTGELNHSNYYAFTLTNIIVALVSMFVAFLIVVAIPGLGVTSYFQLNGFKPAALLPWLGVLFLLFLTIGILFIGFGRNIIHKDLVNIYKALGPGQVYWLFIAMVLVAPVAEEVVFRGLLFNGLKKTRLGLIPAIILSSLIFSLAHPLYDAPELTYVFILGLLFAYVMHSQKSMFPAMILHMVTNLYAFLLITLYAKIG